MIDGMSGPPAVWASGRRCGAARYYPEARVEHGVVLVLFVRNYVDKVWVDMEYIGGGRMWARSRWRDRLQVGLGL